MKFGTVILSNVTKKMIEKHFQSLIMSIFLKNYAKNAKIFFFSKINLATDRKKIFEIFLQLLKVKITCKLSIHSLVCCFLKNPIKRCKNKQFFSKRAKSCFLKYCLFIFNQRNSKATVNYCLYECKPIIMKKM